MWLADLNLPANSGTGHRSDYPRSHSSEEPSPAILFLNNSRSVEQAARSPNLRILRRTSGLEDGLYYVQRRRDGRCDGTRDTTGDTMRERIVFLGRVHDLGSRFVGHELCRGERNGHAQGGGVRDVERAHSFGAVDCFGALDHGLVH